MNKLEPGTKLLVGSHETEVLKYLAEGKSSRSLPLLQTAEQHYSTERH
jgi:hypothetical protein